MPLESFWLNKQTATHYLHHVAINGKKINPAMLESAIRKSGGSIGYVIEFHVDAKGRPFQQMNLIWNDVVLQTYRKYIHCQKTITYFDFALNMVHRIHTKSAGRYPHIEWIQF